MAHPIEHFAVVEVAKPNIGETRPSRVRADVTVNLSVKSEVKVEWENLRKHDVCFLVTVKPLNPIGKFPRFYPPFTPILREIFQVPDTTTRSRLCHKWAFAVSADAKSKACWTAMDESLKMAPIQNLRCQVRLTILFTC